MDRVERPPGLPAVLARLADAGATGCLHVRGSGTSKVHLRAGRLLSVALAADLPARPLGARLLAAGLVTAPALAEAQEAQRTELQGWRLGELLVHLGSADPRALAPHVRDQLVDDLQTLLADSPTPPGTTRFRPGDRVRADLAEPLDLRPLLASLGHDLAPVEEPVEASVEEPVQAAVEEPVEEVVEAPVEEVVDEPVEPPVESPAPVEAPEPVEAPAPEEAPAAPSYAELAAANTRDFADAFAAFAPATPQERAAEVQPEPPGPEAEPAAASTPEQRDPGWDRSDTDTAALLRELSSLGGAEPSAPSPPPTRPAAPTSSPASIAAQRKRKGLFGRV